MLFPIRNLFIVWTELLFHELSFQRGKRARLHVRDFTLLNYERTGAQLGHRVFELELY